MNEFFPPLLILFISDFPKSAQLCTAIFNSLKNMRGKRRTKILFDGKIKRGLNVLFRRIFFNNNFFLFSR